MASPEGVDFSNTTDASNFLGDLLDDSVFQIDGNARARYFWYGISALIGVIAIFNLAWRVNLRQRRRSHKDQPFGLLTRCATTVTQLVRRATYLQVTPIQSASWFKVPPLGIVYLILAYALFILLLEFVEDDNVSGPTWWTLVGVRAAWLAVAQLPLIVLLVGKHSLVGLLTGVSYERLNVLHRWVARGMFLLATLHFALLAWGWSRYPGLQSLEWATDEAYRTGVAAYVIVIWMNLSTVAPLRHLSWDFFVLQHIVTWMGLIIAIAMHIPGSASYALVYVYVAVALYLIERLVYFARFAFTNFGSSKVVLEPLEGNVTKMYVANRRIKAWTPGSHVLIGIPRFGLIQSHPATILSIPSSHNGDMVLLLRAYKGFTRRIHDQQHGLGGDETMDISHREQQPGNKLARYMALINGPYGASHADFTSFETVVLVAGATGVTFTIAVLLDLAHRVASEVESGKRTSPVRKVIFVWLIRKSVWVEWISEELRKAAVDLEKAQIVFDLQVYVTQADSQETTLTNSPVIGPQGTITGSDEKGGRSKSSPDISGLNMDSGRPPWKSFLHGVLGETTGESAVGVCGPLSLSVEVRREVVSLNADRTRPVYLHVESFS
ncbi:hypothetical protein N7539_004264 [Penicillium diatomitis]|uniref:FAD-binding FR-type domain-containing protein n=1 Tax=Penicillium diatomitis TaxID=2819901 RepID=A0A9X0BYB7_9EURO|nr:uncharacterized protein N7539_004264 [Penicillium diatomitis]KAJ5489374.1 hypothetical protein N7539_004264 [Penicillium diatomitis]